MSADAPDFAAGLREELVELGKRESAVTHAIAAGTGELLKLKDELRSIKMSQHRCSRAIDALTREPQKRGPRKPKAEVES